MLRVAWTVKFLSLVLVLCLKQIIMAGLDDQANTSTESEARSDQMVVCLPLGAATASIASVNVHAFIWPDVIASPRHTDSRNGPIPAWQLSGAPG